jgi:hypothetical protein
MANKPLSGTASHPHRELINMDDYNVLKNLANGGAPEEIPFDVEEAIGESWLQRKAEFMAESENLPTAERFSKFEERMSSYKFTRNNVDSYYEDWKYLFPGTEQEADQYAFDKLNHEMDTLPGGDAALGDWIQQKLPSIPTNWHGSLADKFVRIREKGANKEYERTRITSILQSKRAQAGILEKFMDPDKSVDSHVRSLVKAQTAGLIDTIDLDEDGDYTILTPNGRVKANTLPEDTDPVSSFLTYHDTSQAIRKSVEAQHSESARIRRDTSDRATGELRKKLTDIPREFQANIIADWADMKGGDDPADFMRGGIREVVSKTIEGGGVSSPDELIWEYMNIRDEVLNSYLGRSVDA